MTVTKSLSLSVVFSLMMVSLEPANCRAQEATVVRQIEVEVQFVEFSASDSTPLAAKGIVDVDALCGLRETSIRP